MQIIHYSCQMLMKLRFYDISQKYPQIQNFVKIRPVESKMFHGGRWTNMTKQIVVLPNFWTRLKRIKNVVFP